MSEYLGLFVFLMAIVVILGFLGFLKLLGVLGRTQKM